MKNILIILSLLLTCCRSTPPEPVEPTEPLGPNSTVYIDGVKYSLPLTETYQGNFRPISYASIGTNPHIGFRTGKGSFPIGTGMPLVQYAKEGVSEVQIGIGYNGKSFYLNTDTGYVEGKWADGHTVYILKNIPFLDWELTDRYTWIKGTDTIIVSGEIYVN